MHAITIIGCGDIGKRVAKRYQARGQAVSGLVKHPESAQVLEKQQILPVLVNLDDAQSLQNINYAQNTIFYFAPPPPQGDRDPRITSWLASIDTTRLPAKIILLSTTAVYGNADGDWITEESETQPTTDRGKRRLDAERQVTNWANRHQVDCVILRVPGIYGPGRLPRERIEKALPVLNESECGFTNRIHADDLAMICCLAADQAPHGAVFNVSDGKPGTMTDWFNQVADALQLPRPPQISMQEAEQQMSSGMLSYLKESRRIDSSRLMSELNVVLQYDTIAKGIPASLLPENAVKDQ